MILDCLQVLPGLRSIGETEVIFEDGRSYPFDSIIFATGFTRSTKAWLKVKLKLSQSHCELDNA